MTPLICFTLAIIASVTAFAAGRESAKERPWSCYPHRLKNPAKAGYRLEWLEIDNGFVCKRCGKFRPPV